MRTRKMFSIRLLFFGESVRNRESPTRTLNTAKHNILSFWSNIQSWHPGKSEEGGLAIPINGSASVGFKSPRREARARAL